MVGGDDVVVVRRGDNFFARPSLRTRRPAVRLRDASTQKGVRWCLSHPKGTRAPRSSCSLAPRSPMRRRTWAAATLLTLMLGACEEGLVRDEPPPVIVRSGDRSFELRAWAYCFGDTCADDLPPADPLHVGSPGAIIVEFPLDGWSFTAFFARAEGCRRAQRITLEALGLGRSVLRPAGHADTYDVTLFGKGDGDLSVTFRWSTPRDGPLGGPMVRWPCSPSADA